MNAEPSRDQYEEVDGTNGGLLNDDARDCRKQCSVKIVGSDPCCRLIVDMLDKDEEHGYYAEQLNG